MYIIDAGANNGNDTEFYLLKGFKVLAIECNPLLYNKLQLRFNNNNRLILDNSAIFNKYSMVNFSLCDFDEWSTLSEDVIKDKKVQFTNVNIQGNTISNIINNYNVENIYYIKFDIEGGEKDGIDSLIKNNIKSKYLSFEWGHNKVSYNILSNLNKFGYTKFQIVKQGAEYLSAPPSIPLEGFPIPKYIDYTFTNSHSGLFGKELPDKWLDYNTIFLKLQNKKDKWWVDIHCSF